MAAGTMTVYEIVNPSDAYTMASDDPAAAAVACMFLGEGKYALTEVKTGNQACPFFLFGGDPDKWLKETHGVTIGEAMKDRKAAVISALRSVLIGGASDREEVESALALMPESDRAGWLEKRHDMRRSSMNNIGKRAESLAKAIESKQ